MADKGPTAPAATTPAETGTGAPPLQTGTAELSVIQPICQRLTKPGYGTVAAYEVDFIQPLIQEHRPASFDEIGMGSGISTGSIARFVTAYGWQRLV